MGVREHTPILLFPVCLVGERVNWLTMTLGVQAHIMWVQRQDAFKEKFAVEVEESAKNSSKANAT